MKLGIYFTLGDFGLDASVDIFVAAARGGATLLEVGLPFSDPLLDGPVIQASHQRALSNGEHTWRDLCKAIEEIRRRAGHVDISVMASSQLFYSPSRSESFPAVHGILLTDIAWDRPSPVRIPAPRVWFVSQSVLADGEISNPPEEIASIYLTRVQGITGAGQSAALGTKQAILKLRSASRAPLYLGFGISTPADVEECRRLGADGVVVGSAFVAAVHEFMVQFPNASKGERDHFVEEWVRRLAVPKAAGSGI